MSATALIIMCAVIVVALAIWLIMIRYAANHPGQKTRRREQMRGVVQGGQHVGGGRSVAPHRDAPVPEGGGTPPHPAAGDVEDVADDAQDAPAGEAGRRSRNPMDL